MVNKVTNLIMAMKRILLFFIIAVSVMFISCPMGYDVPELKHCRTYTASKGGFGQLISPMGIVSRRVPDSIYASVFVADCSNDRVVLMDTRNDSVVSTIGNTGGESGEFNRPVNLTVTQSILEPGYDLPQNMYLYVADSKNHRIQKFNLDGDFILEWGSFGTDNGQFNTPIGIDMDFEGNIFVVDSGNHRIQVFDTLGNYLNSWGSRGSGIGEFINPIDVVVGFKSVTSSRFSFVAVSDYGNNRVQLFDRSGQFIKTYNNIPDVLGLCTVHYAPHNGYWIVAISSSAKKLYILGLTDFREKNIFEIGSPYDVSYYSITDTVNNRILNYCWSN